MEQKGEDGSSTPSFSTYAPLSQVSPLSPLSPRVQVSPPAPATSLSINALDVLGPDAYDSLNVMRYNPRITREYGPIYDAETAKEFTNLLDAGRENPSGYKAVMDRLAWRWTQSANAGSRLFYDVRDRRLAGALGMLTDCIFPDHAEALREKGMDIPYVDMKMNPALRVASIFPFISMTATQKKDGSSTLTDALDAYIIGWSKPLWQEHQIVHTPDIEHSKYTGMYHHINQLANMFWQEGTPGDDKRHWELAKMIVWLFRIQDPAILGVPQMVSGRLPQEDRAYADNWAARKRELEQRINVA